MLDRLADLIAANSQAPARELMWGAPGTMLIALALHEATGEPRWADLLRAGAQALEESFAFDAELGAQVWTQEIWGGSHRFLGAVHGFAGNAYVVNRGRRLLAEDAWRAWSDRIARTLEATAAWEQEGGLVNWPPHLGPATDGRPARMLLQLCHGAPGVVTAWPDSMRPSTPC